MAGGEETIIIASKFMRALLPIFAVSLLLQAPAFCGGTIEGTITLDAMRPQPVSPGYKPQTVKPIQDTEPPVAIVFLEGPGTAAAARKAQTVRIRQNGYQFRPSILAVQTGTTVEFPNEDDEFHNVFSYSKTKRFDLGRYRKDEPAKLASFDKPGLAKIYCEIHQHMRCLVLVVDTPLFTTTDAKGRFKMTGVPAGDYTMKAFLPSEKTVESKVTVKDGQTLKVAR